MPRYEFSEGSSNKFWEIELEGTSYTTRYGKIGNDGQSTTKEFDSEEKAQKAYDKAIASKVKKGYAPVDTNEGEGEDEGGGLSLAVIDDPAAEEGFISALKKDPNDIDTYLQYADWLQAQGAPRGQLIAVQHRRLTDPENTSLIQMEKDLLETHAEDFYGPFNPQRVSDMVDGVVWFMGFVKSARVRTTYEHDPFQAAEEDVVDKHELLADFLDHPSTMFLQDLSLGIMDFEENGYDGACEIIAARQLPTLQSLFVGDFVYEETELNWSEASTAGIYDSLPNLRSLTVRSGTLSFGDIHAPELREFETISGGMGATALEQISQAHWPKLERMTLQFGPEGLGTRGEGLPEPGPLQPILDGEGLPNLRHLGLTNAAFTDDAVRHLIGSKILPQLQELDFKLGTLTDEGARLMHQHKDAFRHLTFIHVDECLLTDEGIKLLADIGPQIYQEEQRSAEDYGRYPSLYE